MQHDVYVWHGHFPAVSTALDCRRTAAFRESVRLLALCTLRVCAASYVSAAGDPDDAGPAWNSEARKEAKALKARLFRLKTSPSVVP